jgi:transcriptional regulator with XRE-family HTH domain
MADRRRNRVARRTVTMPERVGPHVKLVFGEMARQGFTYDETEEGSGVRRATIKAWRKKNAPGLESLEAVYGWLGWDMVAVPRAKTLPPDVVEELRPLAEKLKLTMPQTILALIEIVTNIHERFPFLRDPASTRPVVFKAKRKPLPPVHPDQNALLMDAPTHVAH